MSVCYRKGPDHHWMTLLRVTKPDWSRPPAANGPERNSPGWVMTVFSAFLFTPFWCPRTPHLTPAATSPVSSQYPCSQPSVPPGLLLSSTLTSTSTQSCGPSVCEEHLAADAEVRAGTICLDERWSSCFSSTVEAGRMEIVPSLAHAESPKRQFRGNFNESKIVFTPTNTF